LCFVVEAIKTQKGFAESKMKYRERKQNNKDSNTLYILSKSLKPCIDRSKVVAFVSSWVGSKEIWVLKAVSYFKCTRSIYVL
jgi:hypothetical protein